MRSMQPACQMRTGHGLASRRRTIPTPGPRRNLLQDSRLRSEDWTPGKSVGVLGESTCNDDSKSRSCAKGGQLLTDPSANPFRAVAQ